ncbi:uncharacterized protein LOC128670408 isoform X2 [Plodia interpunctella]|uniref:uncharacterized protein LOC128670408 isoform X2 n=1 Tax=Plodia interpunctella TaxID=58824 RepID=UPI002367F156|nr:uncharacterized protein LOC128670408 isoform X2 [Plodia interpunctella]
MMVETMLESAQDFSMSNGSLPQWKRELLQRRAARSRAAPPPAQPPPPALAGDPDDEELRYGPGIVKRLKSRYLSLALRDAPRRRPSVLRRAASLEHLLDERPPPAPRPPAARLPRPASVAMPPATGGFSIRRESVKRARSVDALSRLEAREEPLPPSPSPPPHSTSSPPVLPPSLPKSAPPVVPPSSPTASSVIPPSSPTSSPPVAPPLPSPRPPVARSARPPRRPTPLLRETERPPPDVVRSTLRKFESAPTRRPAPAARVSAVLRGLEGPRTSTPEPREPNDYRSPSPVADVSAIDETEGAVVSAEARPVSRAALEGIAKAGSSMRFSFEAPRRGSHLPPLAAANPVLLGRARRVGVIRPMPAPSRGRATSTPTPPPLSAEIEEKVAEVPPRIATPPPVETENSLPARTERRDPPPSALVEPILRSPPDDRAPTPLAESPRHSSREATPEVSESRIIESDITKPLMNGHSNLKPKVSSVVSRLGGTDIERSWNGSIEQTPEKKGEKKEDKAVAPWAKLATSQNGSAGSPPARRARAAPAAATSVVFNFSDRKEVPDYIENDGLILRASRRNRIKPGEPGVVVLRPEALAPPESDSEEDCGPPSPCGVRFVNDNILINGKSSMPQRPNKERQSKLKLQFDDSLTRTFEYPSETSLCSPDERSPAAPAAPAAPASDVPDATSHVSHLAANTHIVIRRIVRVRGRVLRVAPDPPVSPVPDETFV